MTTIDTGAGEAREEIEAVIACLGDDAAQLRQENPEDERADNMDRAAELLGRLLTTPHPQAAPTSLLAVPACKGTNCGITRSDQEHSKECLKEHERTVSAGLLDTPGNRHPEFRYAGYKGRPVKSSCTDDQHAAYQEGQRAAAPSQPVEQVPSYVLEPETVAELSALLATQPPAQSDPSAAAQGEAWKVEYNNDTGFNDEGFEEWWTVTNGNVGYRCDSENDAVQLLSVLSVTQPTAPVAPTPDLRDFLLEVVCLTDRPDLQLQASAMLAAPVAQQPVGEVPSLYVEGVPVIEAALSKASKRDPMNSPIWTTRDQTVAYQDGMAAAYLHALEQLVCTTVAAQPRSPEPQGDGWEALKRIARIDDLEPVKFEEKSDRLSAAVGIARAALAQREGGV